MVFTAAVYIATHLFSRLAPYNQKRCTATRGPRSPLLRTGMAIKISMRRSRNIKPRYWAGHGIIVTASKPSACNCDELCHCCAEAHLGDVHWALLSMYWSHIWRFGHFSIVVSSCFISNARDLPMCMKLVQSIFLGIKFKAK